MKKLGILFASVFLLGLVFQSCNNGKTYAEMKEEEREAIKRFIEREDINVISFEQFQEQDSTTNVDENQFVLFSETGVYMQIVEEGNGERLKDGRYEILARYVEEQITSDGIDSLSWNTDYGNSQMVYPDAMMLTKSGTSFSATFTLSLIHIYNLARKQLYERYAGQLMAVCVRYTGDREVAQDVLHDGFLNIFRSFSQFTYKGEGSLKAWLTRIMVNEALGYLRKKASTNQEVIVEELPDVIDGDEDDFEQKNSFDESVWTKIPRGTADWNNYMSYYDSCYAMPVSYTHLDVYKRQSWFSSITCRKDRMRSLI